MRKLIEWGVFVAVCLGVFLVAGPTSLGGSASYVIVDGTSMEPTYHHGDLVIARERGAYGVGDVITYDAPVGRTYRVIHRVTEVTDAGYLTRGDNRDELDGWVVPFDAVHGASTLVVPHGGTAATWLRHPPVLIALLSGWVTLTLLTRREERRERVTDEGATSAATDDHEPVPVEKAGRSMTAVMMASMALLGLAGGFLVANAAGLVVTGSVIQVFDSTDRPPPVEERRVVIDIEWRFFNNGGNRVTPDNAPSPTTETVTIGDTYEVESEAGRYQNATYAEVACSTVNVGSPAGDWSGSSSFTGTTFTASTPGRHLVCLQRQVGGA